MGGGEADRTTAYRQWDAIINSAEQTLNSPNEVAGSLPRETDSEERQNARLTAAHETVAPVLPSMDDDLARMTAKTLARRLKLRGHEAGVAKGAADYVFGIAERVAS